MTIADQNETGNPLLEYFMTNGGPIIHKWVDYFEVYHRAFARYRNQPITFLEIGVQNGGSARMWRNYFGPEARIIGVDIDPKCKVLEEDGFEIWIGDQADPKFWETFRKSHPSLDIVLDDGGHTMVQQTVTFEALFPILRDGGTYLCEDVHTSYFPSHGGEKNRPGTFIEVAKQLMDQMHDWYHAPVEELPNSYMANNLYAVSVFDSIVVLEKRKKDPPIALARGNAGHATVPATMSYHDMRRAFNIPD